VFHGSSNTDTAATQLTVLKSAGLNVLSLPHDRSIGADGSSPAFSKCETNRVTALFALMPGKRLLDSALFPLVSSALFYWLNQ
jgi:hypothetical protein